MVANILLVAAGGAVGSTLRYLLALVGHRFGDALPWGTLAANVLGCLLIGLLTAAIGPGEARAPWRLAVLVGALGGFTTFSSYTWQALTLLETGHVMRGLLYMLLSNGAGLLAAWMGYRLAT